MKYILAIIFITSLFTAKGSVTTYHYPSEVRKSDKYEITIIQKGKPYPSYVHFSQCPGMNDPSEKVLPMLVDRTMSWTNFSFNDGPVDIVVKKLFGEISKEVQITPKRYGARIKWIDGQSVCFTIDKPEYLSVNFICSENSDESNQIRHGLMIFADEPESDLPDLNSKNLVRYAPDADLLNAKTIYFGPGVYDLTKELPNGMLPIHDNQEVYIDGNAYIYGGIKAPCTYNVKVYGRGILCGKKQIFHYNGLPQLLELEPWNYRTNVHRGGNATVTGVTLLESFNHNMAIPPNSFVKDLKIMAWKVNNDGIRPGNNCVIDHVFMKVADDHLYTFGNTLVTNSLFWPMWNGAIMQVSWGDYGGGGFRFANNDIINAEWNQVWHNNGVIASQASPNSKTEDILVQDLHIEGDLNALANLHFSSSAKGNYPYYGYLRNITFRNVEITGQQLSNNGHRTWYDQIPDTLKFDLSPKDAIKGCVSYIGGYKAPDGGIARVNNVVFENVRINGVTLNNDNYQNYVKTDKATTSGIQFITTANADNRLAFKSGFARSNHYQTGEIGSGTCKQGFETAHHPKNSGWILAGDSTVFLLELPYDGLFDIKASVANDLEKSQFRIDYPEGKTETFTIGLIRDNGYNIHKMVTNKPVALKKGNNRIVFRTLSGACNPTTWRLHRTPELFQLWM